jgi:biopolymer transport protein ExbB
MQELLIFEKGGLVMYGLAALSVYAVAVVIFKVIQFRKANVFDRSFIEPALREIKQGDRERATRILAGIKGPIARIMRVTFECVANREMSQKSKEAEIMRIGSGDIRYLESHLRGLEMTASVAPLMGLLGTVIGMITSFSKLSLAGTRVDPTLLAGGIWEALLTTAGGLAVAIPAMAAHYVLDGIIEKVRATMKDVSVQILSLEDEFRRNERMLAIEESRRAEAERLAREESEAIEAAHRAREEAEQRAREAEMHAFEVERRVREEAELRAHEAERQRHEMELRLQEEAQRRLAEAEELKKKLEAERWAEEQKNNGPKKSSTLHLLSPKYTA